MTIDRMKDINAFVHVAEAKSFTTAAEQIGLSRSAVGKSVSRLEIRLGGADDGRLMTRLLARHRLVTCAAPSYLASRGVPQAIEQLAQHSCLAFVHGGRPVEWRFCVDDQVRSVAIGGRFCATNAEA